MKDEIALIGVILGVLTLVLGMVYFVVGRLIDRNHRQAEELDRAKAANVKHEFYRLEELFKGFKEEFQRQIKRFEAIEESLMDAKNDYRGAASLHVAMLDKIEAFVNKTNARIDDIEKGQFIKIGPDTYIIKSKGAKK